VASNAKLAIKQAGQDISKKIHPFYPSIFSGKKPVFRADEMPNFI
jgi:hypothetical protein